VQFFKIIILAHYFLKDAHFCSGGNPAQAGRSILRQIFRQRRNRANLAIIIRMGAPAKAGQRRERIIKKAFKKQFAKIIHHY
jgi:hypothetical protein